MLLCTFVALLASPVLATWPYPCPPIPRSESILLNQTLAPAANLSLVFCVDPVQFAVLWLRAEGTGAGPPAVPPVALTVAVVTSNASAFLPGPFMQAVWASDRFFLVLKPTVVLPVCGPGVCTLRATVSWAEPSATPYNCTLGGYRGLVVPFERPLQANLSSPRVFGVEMGKSDLTVRVHLSASAPLAVSVFAERDPFHESVLSTAVGSEGSQTLVFNGNNPSWSPGIFLFHLYPQGALSFTFLAESNYSEPSSFSLYGIFASMAFLLVCLFGVALLFARRRLTPAMATPPPTGSEEGATQQQIERLPTAVFSTGLFSAEDSRCAVCLGDYEPGQVLRKLQCAHHFHRECIDCWLRTRRCCPLCQHEIDCPVGPRYPFRAPTVAALPSLTIRVDPNSPPPPPPPPVVLSIRVTSSAVQPVQIAIRVLSSTAQPRRQAFPPSVTQRLAHLALRRPPSPADGPTAPSLSPTPSSRSLRAPTPIDEDANPSVLELPSL